jgi:hypothetical protein
MRAAGVSAILLVVVANLAACGGDDDDAPGAASCEELAAIVADCQGGGLAEVEFIANVCDRFVLSDGCLQEWGSASCAEQDEPEPSFLATCFPPCSDGAPACEGDDAIRVCEDGVESVIRCQAVCGADGLDFTGSCGDEFEGMPSMTGEDICWCE